MHDADDIAAEAVQARPSALQLPSARIALLAIALSCFGLVMVASVAGVDGLVTAALKRLIVTALALGALAVGACTPYQWWRRHNWLVLAASGALLVLVFVPGLGMTLNGARRWLNLGLPVGCQPSEFAKPALCIWVAAYCERNAHRMRHAIYGFLLPMAVVGATTLLILAEPDFGTAALAGAVCTTVLLVFGMRPVFLLMALAAAMPFLQKLIFEVPYRYQRIVAFMDPWSDPRGSGYQLIQSKIAVGSGGLWGRGLGAGLQKAGFLPGADNDFIFSVVAEELGLVGSLAVICLLAGLLWECSKVILRARDPFGFALALGLSWLLGMQAAAHIAVVTGTVPTKGLSLPFVSAGGSSLIASMAAAGILVSIARSQEAPGRHPLAAWSEDVPLYERAVRRALGGLGGVCPQPLARFLETAEVR
ncbi:MAG: putative lipid II flippase FtsW [Candidatus Brocadiaceae bacterium]|nr:putative lipid II flippase FtsW [Candidatus Brocadiaceae bacterium]